VIVIRLASGQTAIIDGVWTVPQNPELARVLNTPEMQPPNNGYYAPTDNARKAQHVLQVWGGTWVSTDEHASPGKLY
jgi:hypothetical protein